MPRSLWNGTIAVGLLNVPVKLYSAVESKTVHFHEVHVSDGARIQHRRFCTKEEREVDYEEIVKGFEVAKGEYVVLDDDERKAAAGDAAHVIDVEDFVDVASIDPVFFDRPYFLGAGEDGAKAYRLLHAALEQTGRAAIGHFTFHDREYLAAIRTREKILALHTMRFADELVSPDDLDVDPPKSKPAKREVEMAAKLVDSLHERFRPERYHDEHREAVLEMLRRKAKGEEIEAPDEPEPEEADDLVAALEASLKAAKR